MTICLCLKADSHRCTRIASTKAGTNTLYCWQHQKCANPAEHKVPHTRAKEVVTSLPRPIPPAKAAPKRSTEVVGSATVPMERKSNTLKKIQKLAKLDNLTIILGASAEEKHIKNYQEEHPNEIVIGITESNQMGESAGNDRTLIMDFNQISDIDQLLPLAGKVDKVIFDYSTFKFARWNPKILTLFETIMKHGAQLIIDCCNFGGIKFAENYMDGNPPIDPKCYTDPNAVEKRHFNMTEPWYYNLFYYYYCKSSDRPFNKPGTDDAIFAAINKITNNIPDAKERLAITTQARKDYEWSLGNLLLGHSMKANKDILELVGFSVEQFYEKPYPLVSSNGPQISDFLIATKN